MKDKMMFSKRGYRNRKIPFLVLCFVTVIGGWGNHAFAAKDNEEKGTSLLVSHFKINEGSSASELLGELEAIENAEEAPSEGQISRLKSKISKGQELSQEMKAAMFLDLGYLLLAERKTFAWESTSQGLEWLENSTELELSGELYLKGVLRFGRTRTWESRQPWERAFRRRLESALRLPEVPSAERARLHYYQAKSLQLEPVSMTQLERRRRHLESTVEHGEGSRLSKLALLELGEWHENYGISEGKPGQSTQFRTDFKAALNYYERFLDSSAGMEKKYVEKAQKAANQLREENLEFVSQYAFLPETEIRFPVRIRNIGNITLTLHSVTEGFGEFDNQQSPESAAHQWIYDEDREAPIEPLIRKELDAPHDSTAWQNWDITLEQTLDPGLYYVEFQTEKKTFDLVFPVGRLVLGALKDGSAFNLYAFSANEGERFEDAQFNAFEMANASLEGSTLTINSSSLDDPMTIIGRSGNSFGMISLDTTNPPSTGLNEPLWMPGNSIVSGGDTLTFYGWYPRIPEQEPEELTLRSHELEERVTAVSNKLNERLYEFHADIPSNMPSGALYLNETSNDFNTYIGYVKRKTEENPWEIRWLGDTGEREIPIFSGSDFPRFDLVHLERMGNIEEVPTVILRVYKIGELNAGKWLRLPRALLHWESVVSGDREILENLEIPVRASSSGSGLFRIEVLEGTNGSNAAPVLSSFFLITRQDTIVQLDSSKRIYHPNDSVKISIAAMNPMGNRISTRGSLILTRDRWHQTYIHRKRGKEISGEEYRELPEKSLLGAAQNDYILRDEGFIKEEIQRIPLEIPATGEEVILGMEEAGLYRFHWEDEDRGAGAEERQSIGLECWVMEGNSDDLGYRPDGLDLVVDLPRESDPENPVFLLIGERLGQQVLIRYQYKDTVQSEWLEMDNYVQRLELRREDDRFPLWIEAMTVEDGRGIVRRETVESANLRLTRLNLEGTEPIYRPGENVSWEFSSNNDNDNETRNILLRLYADHKNFNFDHRWESYVRRQKAPEFAGILSSTRSWPYYRPVDFSSNDSFSGTPSIQRKSVHLKQSFESTFPEVVDQGKFVNGTLFKEVPPGKTKSFALPSESRKWRAQFFSWEPTPQQATISLSTEVPFTLELKHPREVVEGARFSLQLTMKNNLPVRQSLRVVVQSAGNISLEEERTSWTVNLSPDEQKSFYRMISSKSAGSGVITVRIENERFNTEKESSLTINRSGSEKEETFWQIRKIQIPGQDKVTIDIPDFKRIACLGVRIENIIGLLGKYDLEFGSSEWVRDLRYLLFTRSAIKQSAEDTEALFEKKLAAFMKAMDHMEAIAPEPVILLRALLLSELHDADLFDVGDLTESIHTLEEHMRNYLLNSGMDNYLGAWALRALASRHMPEFPGRPTRLEARRFLDLFQDRESLDSASLALLMQTAGRFGFIEEIEPLHKLIKSLGKRDDSGAPYWDSSTSDRNRTVEITALVLESFLVVSDQTSLESNTINWLLENATESNEESIFSRLVAFQSLKSLHRFGDLNTGFRGNIQFTGSPVKEINWSLTGETNLLCHDFDEELADKQKKVDIISSKNEDSILYLLTSGKKAAPPGDLSEFEGLETGFQFEVQRERPTLFGASIMESKSWDSGDSLYPGDRVLLNYEITTNEQTVDFVVARQRIPAGFKLNPEIFPSGESNISEPRKWVDDQSGTLVYYDPENRTLSFLIGRIGEHTVNLQVPLLVEHGGDYPWPPMKLTSWMKGYLGTVKNMPDQISISIP